MSDLVLKPAGGWVIVKRRLPAGLPQVPLFSIFFAKPGDVYFPGDFTAFPPYPWGYSKLQLSTLYRYRHSRAKQSPAEVALAEKMEADAIGIEMQVQIRAPDGDVTLNPYEWVPCGDVRPFIDAVGEGVTLHEYGEQAAPDKSTAWKLFYMQQRGIPKREAVAMLVGDINRPNVFWLEISPEIGAFFDREAA